MIPDRSRRAACTLADNGSESASMDTTPATRPDAVANCGALRSADVACTRRKTSSSVPSEAARSICSKCSSSRCCARGLRDPRVRRGHDTRDQGSADDERPGAIAARSRRALRRTGNGGDRASGLQLTSQTLQVGPQVRCRLVAKARSFSSALLMIASSSAGTSGFSPTGTVGGAVQDRVEDRRRGRATERQRARRHLVQHDAEREEVGARVELLAARLLRRHVRDRADRRARDSSDSFAVVRVRRRPTRVGGRSADQLGQPEVEHLRLAARGDEDVGGLDVAMDDALRVRRVERVGDLRWPGRAASSSGSGCPPIACLSVSPRATPSR